MKAGTTPLEVARTIRLGLDILGQSIPDDVADPEGVRDIIREAYGSVARACHHLERDAPPWDAEVPEIAATWGQVSPGDHVKAPNGEWYEVDSWSRIGQQVKALLKVNGRNVGTMQDAATPVTVRRGAEGRALDVFAAAGMTLERIGR